MNGGREPDLECDVVQLYAVPGHRCHPAPVLLHIKPIRGPSRLESLQQHIAQIPATAVRLDHERLVPADGIHIPEHDILHRRVRAKRANRASARLVAPDALDEDVGRRRLDADAFVAVRDHHVVYPVVRTRDVDPVRSAEVCPTNGEIVEFAVGSLLDDDMEFGR